MTIEVTKDPKTRKEITVISGIVEKIYVNPLKEVKTYTTGKAPWTPTHTVNIVVDGTRIGLGLTDKTDLRAKNEHDKYVDVTEGSEVSVVIDTVGEYQNKPQYNSRASNIFVIKAVPKQQQSTSNTTGSGFSGGKRDNTGVETGHALNGAMRFLGGKATLEDIVTTAKTVHDITSQMKKEYAAANPGMSEYDCGAAVGNAVLNALEIAAARKKTLADVPGIAKKWLTDAVPAVVAHIKPPKVEEKAPEPAPEPAPKPETNEPMSEYSDEEDLSDVPF